LTGRTRTHTLVYDFKTSMVQPCTKNPSNRKFTSRPRLNSYQCKCYTQARYFSRKLMFQALAQFPIVDNLVLIDVD